MVTLLRLLLAVLAAETAWGLTVEIDRSLPPSCQLAVRELEGEARLFVTPFAKVVIGIAGESAAVSEIEMPRAAESFAIKKVGKNLFIAGRDARGLCYALREVARSIRTQSEIIQSVESPRLKVRNVSIHLFNADLERPWYEAEEFWRDYFRWLSFCRFNQFTLTFSDQTNYLCPVYPSLVAVPEFPGVTVEGLTPEIRGRNLAQLKRITDLAAEYEIEFNLGIWMQAPVERYSAPVRVRGLPEGLELARYSALALRQVLAACPRIHGVQLRMNAEAGVPEEQQTAFYQPIFQAIRAVDRPIRLDLRYKGLQPSTTQAALDEKLDVTVSTKFWAEHFGLPYHPTVVDSHWRQDRYSYGNMLARDRKYRVVYQLWTAGSQRLTLWGDPEYARRFAESCELGGGEGFEIFAPLTNRGYGDRPGFWEVIRDPALRHGRWDQDRYWYFYLTFGRAGYHPQIPPEVWRREFQDRFGAEGEKVASALHAASQILPLITAARLPGASEWSWWPEMDTGGSIRDYQFIQSSDPGQFYAIRAWKKSEGWRWEEWDEQPGYVESVLAGRLDGRWTPLMVAERLTQLAEQAETSITSNSLEWPMTRVDLELLAGLARFHAAKLRAATDFAFYELADQPGRLPRARTAVNEALNAWRRIVAVTEKAYHDDLVFGLAPDSPRSKLGHHHTGHWKDRLAEVEADLAMLDALIAQDPRSSEAMKAFPLENSVRPRLDPEIDLDGHGISFGIGAGKSAKRVLMHVRPLDQTQDWAAIPMRSYQSGFIGTALPAASNYPVQYFFEIETEDGSTRWPSWEDGQPYIVMPVAPARPAR